MKTLINKLIADYPQFKFIAGDQFSWSPKNQQINYKPNTKSQAAQWTLLHELAHGLLNHKSYKSDLQLLQLEAEAWTQAKQLAVKYQLVINDNHIQDCLDTYRDWLHRRSICPECKNTSLQANATSYRCFNCNQQWQVSSARFCRPYRKLTLAQANKTEAQNLKHSLNFI